MITEKIFYGLMCDRCREDYDGDEYSYMSDKGEIEETAENDDWRFIPPYSLRSWLVTTSGRGAMRAT